MKSRDLAGNVIYHVVLCFTGFLFRMKVIFFYKNGIASYQKSSFIALEVSEGNKTLIKQTKKSTVHVAHLN